MTSRKKAEKELFLFDLLPPELLTRVDALVPRTPLECCGWIRFLTQHPSQYLGLLNSRMKWTARTDASLRRRIHPSSWFCYCCGKHLGWPACTGNQYHRGNPTCKTCGLIRESMGTFCQRCIGERELVVMNCAAQQIIGYDWLIKEAMEGQPSCMKNGWRYYCMKDVLAVKRTLHLRTKRRRSKRIRKMMLKWKMVKATKGD